MAAEVIVSTSYRDRHFVMLVTMHSDGYTPGTHVRLYTDNTR